jgi:hypothetical protein
MIQHILGRQIMQRYAMPLMIYDPEVEARGVPVGQITLAYRGDPVLG